MVLRERLKCSSSKSCETPTSEDIDMVSCILTWAKFYNTRKICCCLSSAIRLTLTDISHREIMTHEHVEGGGGLCADLRVVAGAALQQAQRQVRALLSFLLEYQLRKLENRHFGQFLPTHSALIGTFYSYMKSKLSPICCSREIVKM